MDFTGDNENVRHENLLCNSYQHFVQRIPLSVMTSWHVICFITMTLIRGKQEKQIVSDKVITFFQETFFKHSVHKNNAYRTAPILCYYVVCFWLVFWRYQVQISARVPTVLTEGCHGDRSVIVKARFAERQRWRVA